MPDSIMTPDPLDDINEQWKKWKATPTVEANASILKTLSPVIDNAVSAHVGNNNPLATSKARYMTLQALKTYDPTKGSRIQSHVFGHLQGLKRYVGRSGSGIKVPERVTLDKRAVTAASKELADELGRDPNDDELASRTGFSMKRIAHVRSWNQPMAEGYFDTVGEGGEPYSPEVVEGSHQSLQTMVYDDLSPLDKKVFEWSLGFNKQPVLQNQQIAERLRRSPGWVSQRRLLIQKMLDDAQAFGI